MSHEETGLNRYQRAMALILCEAIRIRRTERHQEMREGVKAEEKINRLDVRTAIYAMGGAKNTSKETRRLLKSIQSLPPLFLEEQGRCWSAIFKMIDEENDKKRQLINGDDGDDDEWGRIKIFPDSNFGKYISRLLLEEKG